MGSVIGACLGSCVATCACRGCEAVGHAIKDSRVPYIIILFLFTLAAGIMRYFGEPLRLNYIVNIDVCVDPSKCYGVGAVYRLTFCAFVFFALNGLLLTSHSCVRRGVDTGFWIIKMLLLVALLIMSFLLPSPVFDGFFWVAMVVAGVFIIAQIIILIDFAYSWNEDWVHESKNWKTGILVCAFTGYVLSLVALVLLFVYYAAGPNCSLEQAFVSITLVLTLLFTVISTSSKCEHGAILPSAVCTVYCYWILYSALSENPNPQCNSTLGNSDARTIVGFILAAASVAYAAFNVSQNSHALSLKSKPSGGSIDKNDKEAPIKYHDTEEPGEEEETHEDTEELLAEQTRRAWQFQVMMASGACYACMLLTDWGEASPRSGLGGKTSVWIQIVSQWLAALLYTWSLVAPYVLTNREF